MNSELPINIELPEDFLDEEVRFNYKITREIKELWAVELDLYFELKRVCNKYNLKFLADAGTILGAVRDSGFIPWDDDLDFSMMREDYEKLCEVAKDEFKYPYFWQTEEMDPGSCRGHGQLRNSETTAILNYDIYNGEYFNFNQGIFIDVFPFDNVPDDETERHAYLKEIGKLMKKITSYRDVMMGQNRSTGIKKVIKFIMMLLYYNRQSYNNRSFIEMENMKQKYRDCHTDLIANILYIKDDNLDALVRPKKWFENSINVPFEFTTINIPCGYESYLEKAYGNWRKRVNGGAIHKGMIYDCHKPYKDYINEKITQRQK